MIHQKNCDENLLKDHYITIVPIKYDMTSYKEIEDIQNIFKNE